MKIKKNVFRVKNFSIIWIGKSNTVMTEIKKALVAEEQSRQSYNLEKGEERKNQKK